MIKKTSSDLRKRRQALLRTLPPLVAILRGSLIERYKPCGKPGCKCADGPGHGPKYYLANYQRVREILEKICEINRELLRRREAL